MCACRLHATNNYITIHAVRRPYGVQGLLMFNNVCTTARLNCMLMRRHDRCVSNGGCVARALLACSNGHWTPSRRGPLCLLKGGV